MDISPIPSYEDMIKAGMHFGRKKTIFHPNMKPFIYAAKENIYLIDLIRTSEALTNALDFLKKALSEGKLILFVGITKPSMAPIKATAEALNMPYVVERWLGGTLTNFKVITSRVKHLEDLEKEQASGGFDKYTKKERLLKEREIIGLRLRYDGLRKLTRLPDVVFVSSLKESQLSIHEALIMHIATVGLVNTDSNPKQLTYPIPANDNARKSVELVLEAIKQELISAVPVPAPASAVAATPLAS